MNRLYNEPAPSDEAMISLLIEEIINKVDVYHDVNGLNEVLGEGLDVRDGGDGGGAGDCGDGSGSNGGCGGGGVLDR